MKCVSMRLNVGSKTITCYYMRRYCRSICSNGRVNEWMNETIHVFYLGRAWLIVGRAQRRNPTSMSSYLVIESAAAASGALMRRLNDGFDAPG